MRSFKYIILIISIVLLIPSAVKSQVNVTRVTDPAAFESKEGTFYYLPGTYLKIDVHFDLVQKIRGPYAEYAFKFMGLDSVVRVNERYYEINDIRCSVQTGPDPGQLYFVEFLQKQSKDPLEMHMILSEEGYLSEVAMGMELSAQPAPERVEEICKEISFGPENVNERFRYYATDNQVVKIDTIIKMVTIDTSTFKDITYKRSKIYKTMEERASEAAEFVENIRKDRYKLLTGYQEVNYDQGTLQYMDSKLLEMEDAYLSLFRGHCQRESYHARVTWFPQPDHAGQEEVILYLSNNEGITRSATQQGVPVTIRIEPAGDRMPASLQGSAAAPATGQGFVFRLPRLCHVTVTFKGKEFIMQDIPVHQYGILSHYPATSRFHIQLHPTDGSVRQIGVR